MTKSIMKIKNKNLSMLVAHQRSLQSENLQVILLQEKQANILVF